MTMLNRTAASRRPLSRVGYAAGLLVLIGAVTALVVVVRVPAHSITQSTTPAPPAHDGSVPGSVVPGGTAVPGTDGHPPGTGAGQPGNVPAPPAGSGAPAEARLPLHAAGPDDPGDAAADLYRSLVWSGLLGLAISLTGLGIVGSRRRMW